MSASAGGSSAICNSERRRPVHVHTAVPFQVDVELVVALPVVFVLLPGRGGGHGAGGATVG